VNEENLIRLRAKYGDRNGGEIYTPSFQAVAAHTFSATGTRRTPYSGVPTFLSLPYQNLETDFSVVDGLDVAVVGIPMDLGVTNRPGSRFGPRALRQIERIGPYNEALDCTPGADLRAADVGDIPFRSRYDLAGSHEDIEAFISELVGRKVIPLSVGGDHSITYSILRAIGRERPVGLVHIDAHSDTGGPFDGSKFHHGGPFRNAVLDGVLDPQRTIQIGIRGSSEYLWEFAVDSGMTVVHADEVSGRGIDSIARQIRQVIGDGPTYVSFDIDSLDPAFAPGTGTPEIGGLTSREVLALLRSLKGIDMVGGDVVEVAPQYDATSNTAHAGAQVLFELLSLLAVRRSR
jgi:agmatinase